MAVEELRERVAGVLRAGIRVMDELDVGAASTPRQRHPQRIENEVGAHVRGGLPADRREKTSMTKLK
jgi:hypothetical protein